MGADHRERLRWAPVGNGDVANRAILARERLGQSVGVRCQTFDRRA